MKELVDALATNAGFFFVLLAIMWGLQFVLAFYQLRRFNRRIFEVRKHGKTAVGLSGGRYSGRTYAILAIDETGHIVHAEHFAGATIFARLRPVPDLIGMTLDDMRAALPQLPLSGKSQRSFINAADYLQEAPKVVQDVETQPA